MTKRILKITAILLLILTIGAAMVIMFMDFRWSDKKYLTKIAATVGNGSVYYTPANPGQIRFIRSGDDEKQPMVFLHGAPGSNRDFKDYLMDTLLAGNFNMIAVDRPGYGYSNYGHSVTSIKEQADIIATGLPDSSIIVGHSYGGPVASALAMYHPEKVKELILLAPAVDPENEKQFFVNNFMRTRFLRFFISPAIEVALDEKLTHEEALEQLLPDWNKLEIPVTLVHGEGDGIVPYENVAFLESVLVNAQLKVYTPEGMNHIMIWSDFEWVKELLLSFKD